MKEKQILFVPRIFIPQDHGSWVFLLSPLLIGIAAGGKVSSATLLLALTALAAFLSRQPVTNLVKILSGRRARTELGISLFWSGLYAILVLAGLVGLAALDHAPLFLLGLPALPVFALHLYLVSRRAERKQAGVEIAAAGVLALSAPAAYWIGRGNFEWSAAFLWLMVWFQSAASIMHAYMRLAQRNLAADPGRNALWTLGKRAVIYTSANLGLAFAGGLIGILPGLLFLPFLLQWLETLWGLTHPATGWKPTKIGLRQLLVSTLFTILFILTWR